MKTLAILLFIANLSFASEFDEFEQMETTETEKSSPWSFAGFFEVELGHNISGVGLHQNNSNSHDLILSNQRARLQTMRAFEGGAFYGKADLFHDDVRGHTTLDFRELRIQKKLSDNIDVSLGRQVSTWGVADMMFINDLFPKNWVANFTGRDMEMLKDPSNALRVTGYFGNWTADLVYQPEFTPDTIPTGCRFSVFDSNSGGLVTNTNSGCSKYRAYGSNGSEIDDDEIAFSLRTKIKDHQLSFYYYDGYFKQPRALISGSPMTPYHSKLNVFGVSDEGQLGPGIFTFEAGYYDSKDDKDGDNFLVENSTFRYLFGYRQDLSANFSYGVQWYQERILDYDEYEKAFLTSNSAGYAYRRKEAQNTFTLRLTYKMQQETLWFSLFSYLRPEDKDSFTKLEVSKKFTDNLKVVSGVNIFTGEKNYLDREFGMLKDDDNFFFRVNYSY